MSAFIVGHDHIDALLTFATDRRSDRLSYYVNDTRVEITHDNVTEIGRILLTENERSVRHRYPGDDADDLPGTIGEDAAGYSFTRFAEPLTAVSVLKGCDCFDYQSCETDDYRHSLAYAIVSAIRNYAISRLPEYSDGPGWEFRRKAKVVKPIVTEVKRISDNVTRITLAPRPAPDDDAIKF